MSLPLLQPIRNFGDEAKLKSLDELVEKFHEAKKTKNSQYTSVHKINNSIYFYSYIFIYSDS